MLYNIVMIFGIHEGPGRYFWESEPQGCLPQLENQVSAFKESVGCSMVCAQPLSMITFTSQPQSVVCTTVSSSALSDVQMSA